MYIRTLVVRWQNRKRLLADATKKFVQSAIKIIMRILLIFCESLRGGIRVLFLYRSILFRQDSFSFRMMPNGDLVTHVRRTD